MEFTKEEKELLAEINRTPVDDPRYEELGKKMPLHPVVAMAFKEGFGADYIRNGGFNLSKAEEVYGKDWLEI